MPKEFQYLRIAIKAEQFRLLNWAEVVQLNEFDENLLIAKANKQVLLDALEQQKNLLMSFGRVDEKYRLLRRPLLSDEFSLEVYGGNEVPPAYESTGPNSGVRRAQSAFQNRFPQSEQLLQKSLAYVERHQKYPMKLKWALFDKTKVEELVRKITGINDYMNDLLTMQQLDELVTRQKRTEYQIMQLNGKMDQLLEIFESGTTFTTQPIRSRIFSNPLQAYLQRRGIEPAEDSHTSSSSLQRLASLAQSKALISALDTNHLTDSLSRDLALGHSATEIKEVELSRSRIQLLHPEPEEMPEAHRAEALYHHPNGSKQHVWIEWKTYDPMSFNGGPDPKILERLRALTALLKEIKRTEQFRAPHCLGYFRDVDENNNDDLCRFGLVFEKPTDVRPRTRPLSLLEILCDDTKSTPSLTARIKLCHAISEIVEKLHAVDWLHKGLRSHNIIFFPSDETDSTADLDDDYSGINFAEPYISGFDYSRPAQNEDLTEKPPENAAYDLYRHPKVHGSGPKDTPTGTSYKKSYDIYSLGVILLEIAYWKPIHAILGIDLSSARPSQTFKVRDRLLNERNFLKYVKGNLGDKVFGVVDACLKGLKGFGLDEGSDERVPEVAELLQGAFYDVVVRRLAEVKV
jgi:hypothetical protein